MSLPGLGIGNQITDPSSSSSTSISTSERNTIHLKQASCGSMHSLFLTSDGKVYSCGNNDHGQLGHDLSRKRPRMSMFRMC